MVIISLSFVAFPLSKYCDFKINEIIEDMLMNNHGDIFQNFNSLILLTDAVGKLNAIILFFGWMKVCFFPLILSINLK